MPRNGGVRAAARPVPAVRYAVVLFALALLPLVLLPLTACAPIPVDTGPSRRPPALTGVFMETRDGLHLPYRIWPAAGGENAVVVALHGFNDYGEFFDGAARYLAGRGVTSYAYDQRGFGGAMLRGRWFETARYAEDAGDFLRLVAARHSGKPVYLLGDSMGGAIAMLTLTGPDAPPVAGAVLVAPAVWGRVTMPWYQRAALWFAAHTVPAMPLSTRGIQVTPSDNIEMLRALGRDPLIIKGARVDTVHGLVDLMDAALAAAPRFETPALILYGGRDDIVPKEPVRRMLTSLPPAASAARRIAVYDAGYHMLLRDLAAETVWRDVAAWIEDPARPLPSGAEAGAQRFLSATADR